MGRPKKILSPGEEAERKRKRREAGRDASKARRRKMGDDPEWRAKQAEAKRRYDSTHRDERRQAARLRRASDPGLLVMENFKRRERKAKAAAAQSDFVSGGGPVEGVLSPGVTGAGWQSEPVSPGQAGSRAQSWRAVPPTVKGMEDTTTLTASMPHTATSAVPEGSIMPMHPGVVGIGDISCCQTTRATVTTRTKGTQCALTSLVSSSSQATVTFRPIGTQCALLSLISSSSQTCAAAFPVYGVTGSQARASLERFSASRDGAADITAEAGPHTCSCRPHSGNTGDRDEIQFREKLHSCLLCQRHHHTTDVKVAASAKKPYVCSVCKNIFGEQRSLDRHMRVHTGKLYICSICQKSFSQKNHLVDHERLHSGVKPYVCSICPKSFTQRSHLISHERVHSGDRPYACSTCQKSFVQRCHLNNHERLHSGEKPYKCSICHKSFTNKGNQVRHEKKHSV